MLLDLTKQPVVPGNHVAFTELTPSHVFLWKGHVNGKPWQYFMVKAGDLPQSSDGNSVVEHPVYYASIDTDLKNPLTWAINATRINYLMESQLPQMVEVVAILAPAPYEVKKFRVKLYEQLAPDGPVMLQTIRRGDLPAMVET